MYTRRQLAGRTIAGLFLVAATAGCKLLGPELNIDIDNTGGPRDVTVTVHSSGSGMAGGEDVVIHHGEGAAWSVPLGSTWEVKVNGNHVIGSGDRTDLALPSPGQAQDVDICIRISPDGTGTLYDGCRVVPTRQASPSS